MASKTTHKTILKTREDYNLIAEHFASTRKKALWPDIVDCFTILNPTAGKKLLDAGSGSGRLFPLVKSLGLHYTGVDISPDLVKISKKEFKDGEFLTGDVTNLPFLDNSYDYLTSIAVIYHIPTDELRQKSLDEFYRVLKPGGEAIISLWYFWNKAKFRKRILHSIFRKNEIFNLKDFDLPWKNSKGEIITNRYCHAWTLRELRRGLRKAGFTEINVVLENNKIGHNLNIICKKPQ